MLTIIYKMNNSTLPNVPNNYDIQLFKKTVIKHEWKLYAVALIELKATK